MSEREIVSGAQYAVRDSQHPKRETYITIPCLNRIRRLLRGEIYMRFVTINFNMKNMKIMIIINTNKTTISFPLFLVVTY